MKRLTIFTLFLIVNLGLTFLGANLVPAAEKIKIGCLVSFTGAFAMWDIPIGKGIELMVDKINREGGIKVGIKTYQIDLINADYKTNLEGAVSQTNRLIFNEKVSFIIGPGMSGAALAAQPITEKNKVIMMSYCFTPKILGEDKPYTFRLYASGSEVAKAILIYLHTHLPDLKTIGLVGLNDETGWGTSKDAKASAEEIGMKVVFEDFVQRGTTDFFPVLTRMLLNNPHVLIPTTIPPGDTALFIQQARQLGYKGLIASPSRYDPEMMVTKAGEAAEGFIFQSQDFTGPTATPMMREFYKNYMQKYKEAFNPMANMVYPTPWILKMAIEKAGTLDTTAVAKAMENVEGEYPWGYFTMGGLKTYGAKHQIAEPIWLGTIRQGKPFGLGYVAPPVP
jgi:branched-chain amino acid transport system substrate-binding protein